jgi:hypothetical protein
VVADAVCLPKAIPRLKRQGLRLKSTVVSLLWM